MNVHKDVTDDSPNIVYAGPAVRQFRKTHRR